MTHAVEGALCGMDVAATGGDALADPAATCLRPGGLRLTERVVELACLPARARVLDVGCGAGVTVAHLVHGLGLRAVGIDASPAQVSRAREARPDLDVVVGRAENLPFADGAFDAVLAECVLSTLGDARAALGEMTRVLARGGCLLVTDVYTRGGSDVRPPAGLPSLGRAEAVKALFGAASLVVETWGDHTGALARLFWDMARPGGASDEALQARRAAPGTPGRLGRRLGYFVCVARRGPCARSVEAKGVWDAGS